jgi:hypothetical protein
MARTAPNSFAHTSSGNGSLTLYGGIAAGVLLGAALSTYLWRRRVRALNLLNLSPLERAEQMLANIERNLASIEQSFEELKAER